MATTTHIERTRAKEQSGIVLLTVLLLVVMFTGVGLMAMRHTQGELRSAGAYLDSTQAALAAEAGLAMVTTDMRLNFEDESEDCVSYAAQFNTATWDDTAFRSGGEKTFFSPAFNPDCSTYPAGTVPLPELAGTSPLAQTPVLANATANVVIVQERPVLAGPPPGFSGDGQNQSYDWYYFSVHSTASYGVPSTSGGTLPLYVRGNAEAEARVMIGPVIAF